VDINNLINKNIADPHELERMFRKEPEAFKKLFSDAWEQNPDSPVLAVWYERLHFREEAIHSWTAISLYPSTEYSSVYWLSPYSPSTKAAQMRKRIFPII